VSRSACNQGKCTGTAVPDETHHDLNYTDPWGGKISNAERDYNGIGQAKPVECKAGQMLLVWLRGLQFKAKSQPQSYNHVRHISVYLGKCISPRENHRHRVTTM